MAVLADLDAGTALIALAVPVAPAAAVVLAAQQQAQKFQLVAVGVGGLDRVGCRIPQYIFFQYDY